MNLNSRKQKTEKQKAEIKKQAKQSKAKKNKPKQRKAKQRKVPPPAKTTTKATNSKYDESPEGSRFEKKFRPGG